MGQSTLTSESRPGTYIGALVCLGAGLHLTEQPSCLPLGMNALTEP